MDANIPFFNLKSLVELSNNLTRTHDKKFIFNASLLSLVGKIGFLRAVAYDFDTNNSKFTPVIAKGKGNEQISEITYLDYSSLGKLGENIFFDKPKATYYILLGNLGNPLGLFKLSKRLFSEDLTSNEIDYIQIVANLTTNALIVASNYQKIAKAKYELEIQNFMLSTLFEISRDFSLLLDKEQILNNLKFRLMGQLVVNRFALFTNFDGNIIEFINRFDRKINTKCISELFNVPKIKKCNEIHFANPELMNFCKGNKVEIISPMYVGGIVKGVLLLGERLDKRAYSNFDLNFIESFGNTVILSLENLRLIQEEIQKKQLEKEIHLALEIQQNLLPQKFPNYINIDIWGTTLPAKTVGGDYYDIIEIDDNSFLVVVADVSGKGIPASLLMANLQSALKILAQVASSPKEIILRLNDILYRNTSPDKFVTLFLGKFDLKNYTVTYVNAGHNPPIHFNYKNDNIEFLAEGGIILGIFNSENNYTESIVSFEKGDIFVFYTDGLSEATNQNFESFSEDGIIKSLKKHKALSSKEICQKILDDVRAYTNSLEQEDDLTVIVIKILDQN